MDFKSPPAVSFVFVGVEGPFGDFGFFSWKGLPGNSSFFLSSKGPPAIRGGESTLLTPSPGEKRGMWQPSRKPFFTKEAQLWGLPANFHQRGNNVGSSGQQLKDTGDVARVIPLFFPAGERLPGDSCRREHVPPPPRGRTTQKHEATRPKNTEKSKARGNPPQKHFSPKRPKFGPWPRWLRARARR